MGGHHGRWWPRRVVRHTVHHSHSLSEASKPEAAEKLVYVWSGGLTSTVWGGLTSTSGGGAGAGRTKHV